jgi:GDPmannose 4,6-dehydratase
VTVAAPFATALITGITGQDGGYLAEQLAAAGVAVHGVVRAQEVLPRHITDLPSVVAHEVDLRTAGALTAVVDAVEPDVVFNLAGVSSVAQSWAEPALTAEVNGLLPARLLESLWTHHADGRAVRIIQASSAEIFAGTTSSPQNEKTQLCPRSPYGVSKAFAHQLVQVFRGRGLHASNAILYNHESPRRPVTFVTRKITSGVAAIADGRADELVLGSLEPRRDWGWAPEYVDAMVRMSTHDVEPDDFVIATGQAHSVEDFVAAAFARVGVADWRPLVRVDPEFQRPNDAVELVGDARKAHEQLGWRTCVSFEELVWRMVDYDLQGPEWDA